MNSYCRSLALFYWYTQTISFVCLVLQGLFVPSARVGSGDPVRVLCLFHNEYTR